VHENSKIGEDAADDIAAALSSNPKLHVLDFNDNNLQTTGMIKISKALQKFLCSLNCILKATILMKRQQMT